MIRLHFPYRFSALVPALLALTLAVWALAIWAPAADAGIKGFRDVSPPAPLPNVAVMTLEGEPYALTKILPAGKPAVVNLWATWCPPCIKELPALVKLQAALGDRVVVAALSVDRGGPKTVGDFIHKTGLKGLLMLSDPRADSLQELKTRGLPTTLLLDAEHREIARYEGDGDWDKPETLAEILTRLGLPKGQ